MAINLIRFSEPRNLAEVTDRLNKNFLELYNQLRALAAENADLRKEIATLKNGSKPDYPGVGAGSKAIIGGPPQGGPSPLPPWIPDHAMLIAEGSKPIKAIIGTDGQIPIACTNSDPAFANITGDGPAIETGGVIGLLGVNNSCNGIAIGVNASFAAWIIAVSAHLGIGTPS